LALNCRIAKKSKFDRKNYFYPDLPKGYQISQYDQPLCEKGFLEIALGKEKKRIGITRIHLEEDTGKSIHQKATGETLIDFNRAGVPLMELVTEPDIVSSLEAKKFCESLRSIFRYLGISSADMEKGQMRCEANISLYLPGKDPLSGTKVELKNINSFKAVEKGIEYEIRRQTEILEEGGHVIQETRGWNDSLGKTFPQRKKENSDDYRYFPEPDILPLSFSDREIEMIGKSLPELPLEKKDRLVRQYGLSEENAEIVVSSKDLAQYFEEVASELDHWMEVEEHEFDEQTKTKVYKLAVNYLLTEIQKHLFHKGLDIKDMKVTPENFAELIKIIYDGQINSSAAQVVLEEMFETGADPSRVIEEKDLVQSNDESELDAVVDGVLKKNQPSVDDYKKGKQNAIQYLMGQVMSETKGKANPQMVIKILKEKLDKIIEVEPQ
jgi:aspartyl-tRNA(Asn)/glutamyl-tRNA(Gln) amidotransferase subunit B